MSEIPQIVLPHGGYRKLTAFQKSEVVYQMTVVFCRRFCRHMATAPLTR